LELLDTVGYRENVGHKLVSEAAAGRFEQAWRAQLCAASPDVLSRESGLLWMMLLAKNQAGTGETVIQIPDSPSVTLALVRSAHREVRSQAMGSRAVQRSARLAWKELIELYGDEDVLRRRIEELRAVAPDGSDELLQLTDKYAGGWRPKDFGRY
jgi:hypothetical protein